MALQARKVSGAFEKRTLGARFSKAPETFRARKAIAKSQTLRLQSCFIHIFLNRKRSSLHTRSSRRVHFSVFRYRWTKNGFTAPKSFRGFRETGPRVFEEQGPGRGHCVVFLGKTLYATVSVFTQVYKWVPANLMLGVTLRWNSIPSRRG